MFALESVTRTTTGNVTLKYLTNLSFKETSGSATASFTLRRETSGGGVVESRTLLANESDSIPYGENPEVASTGVFHLTVDSGAVSVTCKGQVGTGS